MAQHVIRDSNGRIEKILDDKEYSEHKKKKSCMGCLAIIIIGIACLWASQDNESDSFEEPSSVIQSSSSISTPEASSSDVSQDITTESNTSGISIAADEEAPTEEEAATEETATEAATTVQEDNALTAVNAEELPQELSRKERRALKKAQRKAEKERKALEKAEKKRLEEMKNTED